MTDHKTPDHACLPAPKEVHGYLILRDMLMPARRGEQRFRVILVDRGEAYEPERYVTAELCVGWTSWISGHYFRSLTEASQAFDERTTRILAR